MDRATYEDYLAKFNARDYAGVLAYYADEMEVCFAGYRFASKAEVARFYAFFHQHVSERIALLRFGSDDRTAALEAIVRLEGLTDLTPEGLEAEGLGRLVPLAKGQVVEMRQFIHYHLDDERRIVGAYCAVVESPEG